jgi:hypothetical protein
MQQLSHQLIEGKEKIDQNTGLINRRIKNRGWRGGRVK